MTTSTPTATDHEVTLNGLRFHYLEWGAVNAPPLLLLHGFTGHARSWDTFSAAMADRYRVFALDQRGHGDSEWADDYAGERMVEDIAAFVAALELKHFALLGLSMGGRNAFAYASTRPPELERLVIVDIGPEIATAGSNRIRAGVQASDIFADPEDAYRAQRAVNPRPPDPELHHRVMNNMKQLPDGTWTFKYDKTLRSPDRPLPRPEPATAWAGLANINVPTLLVRGVASDVLSEETAARMVREIPECTFVTVQDAGHSIPLDNPAGFIAAVRPFLAG
jgi:pimeloyl-ACP methyl ester carboxylesterase